MGIANGSKKKGTYEQAKVVQFIFKILSCLHQSLQWGHQPLGDELTRWV
jgi:hypothetical protein